MAWLFQCWFNGENCMQYVYVYWQLPLTTAWVDGFSSFKFRFIVCSLESVFICVAFFFLCAARSIGEDFFYWHISTNRTRNNNNNNKNRRDVYINLYISMLTCRLHTGDDDDEKCVWMCWSKNHFFHNGLHLCGKLVSSASEFCINSNSNSTQFMPI